MTGPRPAGHFDPLVPQRNAMEVFLLAIALWSAARTFFFQPEPLAVVVLLGPVWAIAWAITLSGGALVALLGLFWTGRPLTALSLQEMGYAAFAPASVARGAALIQVGRPDESVVLFAFALAVMVRIWQLERRIGRFYPVRVIPPWFRRVLRRE